MSPCSGLFDEVVGQPEAVATLQAALVRPVHAYLFLGPPGSGKAAASRAFAAGLLCAADASGDPLCDSCRRALGGVHPDVVVVEREGAFIRLDEAVEVVRLAARSPVEGRRKVLILNDFHLVREVGPALLKTIEEPPPSTVFVILAEYCPPELVTIASRCFTIRFHSLTPAAVAEALVREGVEPGLAARLGTVSEGRLDRARLLAEDPELEARRSAWEHVPARLDGTGATAYAVAAEMVALLDQSAKPLRARQAQEVAAAEEIEKMYSQVSGRGGRGARGGGAGKALEDRHKREVRRQRTDELRAGLSILVSVYRDRLSGPGAAQAVDAIDAITTLSADLAHHPGELLALQALMVKLDRAAQYGGCAPRGGHAVQQVRHAVRGWWQPRVKRGCPSPRHADPPGPP
ncbi:MAG: DNA polymerase III subunit delta' [Acidimicrobiales bacterium]